MRVRLSVSAAVLAVVAWAAPSAAAAVHLTPIAGFNTPVYVTAPPGDPHRLFVVEREGRVQEVRDGQKLGGPFLDISGSVRSTGYEQGLLSMAFAPDYATSRKFYVYYTAPGSGAGSVITIQELRTRAGNPDAVEPGSRRTVLTVDHPGQDNHNGGQLQFGPDGRLYAGTGDGGNSNDRGPGRAPNNAQNLSSRLGKLLRFNPGSPAAPEIYAYGLRNPWRFSFDRQTGAMVIGDVGESAREEVDFLAAGAPAGTNFGWVCWEGTLKNADASPSCDPANAVFPVLERNHGSDRFCALVGGYVVRDPALGALNGRYLYGDNCNSAIHSVAMVAPPARVGDDTTTGFTVSRLTSFGEDSCGHVYVTSGAGTLSRIDGDSFTPCPGGGPAVRIFGSSWQRVARQRGVRLRLWCSEHCTAVVRASVRIAGSRRRYAVHAVTRKLAPGRRPAVSLRLSGAARRAVAKALLRKRRVRVTVKVTAVNSSGARSTTGRTIQAQP